MMMLKIKINSKGFIVSPFFVIVLILLGIALISYFSQSDLERAKSIIREGQINQIILEMEELKPIMQTLALFLSYQSAYEVGEKSGEKKDLEETIERYINEYFKNYSSTEGIITTQGNFSVFVVENLEGSFLTYINKSPNFDINKSGIQMNSTLTLERAIDARFFLLYRLAKEMNISYLIDTYTMKVMSQLLDKFDFNIFSYVIENDSVIIHGAISDITQANNGSFIKKIFENAIVDFEKDSKFLFPEINNNSCAIIFMPKLITVNGTKEIFGENKTIWSWKVNISLITKIFDYSQILDNETSPHGFFQINVSKPIILKNGTLAPLGYKVIEEKTSFFYHISTIYNAIDNREFLSYTKDMFNNETHLPKYTFLFQ